MVLKPTVQVFAREFECRMLPLDLRLGYTPTIVRTCTTTRDPIHRCEGQNFSNGFVLRGSNCTGGDIA